VPATGPSFSPYPFERLRRITRRDAAFESALARWLGARPPSFDKLVQLAAGPVSIRIVGGAPSIDPHASLAEVRADGVSIEVAASSRSIRALAQRWLGGPDELDAPRPLTSAEHGIWCLVVAAALSDFGIAAQVWPAFDKPLVSLSPTYTSASAHESTIAGHARVMQRDPRAVHDGDAYAATMRDNRAPDHRAPGDRAGHAALELAVTLGNVEMTVVAFVPRALELRVPAPRAWPRWTFDLPIVLGRAAVPREALARLALRDIITIERALELDLGEGSVGLTAVPRAVEATVATGYVRRDMALPDDAHLELTVQLGTTRMSLRALSELAVGQVISLGRPLAGPFEVRAGGRLVGQGELVDVDGELGVRIVSLAQE